MENVIAKRMKNVKLTKAQQKIAEYFIQNPERVGISSSMEVAKEIGVSDASITRFAHAIGYECFIELKNDIYSNFKLATELGHELKREAVLWHSLPPQKPYIFGTCPLISEYALSHRFSANSDRIVYRILPQSASKFPAQRQRIPSGDHPGLFCRELSQWPPQHR